ncbi:luciferin 4-monooxygenase-like [Amblyomma americanum]
MGTTAEESGWTCKLPQKDRECSMADSGAPQPKASQQAARGPAAIVEDRVVRSAVPEPPLPDCDFATCLRNSWQQFKDRTALIEHSTDERCSYEQLEEQCSRVAAGLRSLGFGPGDMAGFHCGSSLDAIIACYGVVLAGGCVVMAKPNLSQRELSYQFGDSSPSLVFSDEELTDKVIAVQKEVPSIKTLVVFGNHAAALPFAPLKKTPLSECQAPQAPADPGSLLFVLYSSGTTGKPKGVMISHRNAVAQFTAVGAPPKPPIPPVVLGVTPFTHASGVLMVNAVFARGDSLVILSCPEPSLVIPAIAKHKAVFMFEFPTHLRLLLKSPLLEDYDLSSLKVVSVAGSTVPPDLVTETKAKLKVFALAQGYGLTESFGAGTFTLGQNASSDCVGTPHFMSQLKIVDITTGEKLGPGQRGEIRIRSPCCCIGYLNNPEASAALYDEEGFLKSGDMGYYNEQGVFYITDRVKDLIKCMDQQVPPAELEGLLLQHEAVLDVAVVGVPHDDYGEAARAFVVLREGHEPSQALKDALFNLVADQASYHKHLHGGVEFAASIPKSFTGKPLRSSLRDAHAKQAQASP